MQSLVDVHGWITMILSACMMIVSEAMVPMERLKELSEIIVEGDG